MNNEMNGDGYSLSFFPDDSKLVIRGNLRLDSVYSYDEIVNFVTDAFKRSGGEFHLDLTRLETLNSSGIAALGMFLVKSKEDLRPIKVMGSRYITWQAMSLESLKDLRSNLSIEMIVEH